MDEEEKMNIIPSDIHNDIAMFIYYKYVEIFARSVIVEIEGGKFDFREYHVSPFRRVLEMIN